MISTHGFEAAGDINVIVDHLNFIDIKFENSGHLLDFGHHLINPVQVHNANFENISSGSVKMEIISLSVDDEFTNSAVFDN